MPDIFANILYFIGGSIFLGIIIGYFIPTPKRYIITRASYGHYEIKKRVSSFGGSVYFPQGIYRTLKEAEKDLKHLEGK